MTALLVSQFTALCVTPPPLPSLPPPPVHCLKLSRFHCTTFPEPHAVRAKSAQGCASFCPVSQPCLLDFNNWLRYFKYGVLKVIIMTVKFGFRRPMCKATTCYQRPLLCNDSFIQKLHRGQQPPALQNRQPNFSSTIGQICLKIFCNLLYDQTLVRAETNTSSTRLPGSSKYPNNPIASIRIRWSTIFCLHWQPQSQLDLFRLRATRESRYNPLLKIAATTVFISTKLFLSHRWWGFCYDNNS